MRKNDPRLQELADNLKKEHAKSGGHEGVSHETQKLDREQFKRSVFRKILFINIISNVNLNILFHTDECNAKTYKTLCDV